MLSIVKALKELGKKTNTAGTAPAGKTIAEVIGNIATAFNIDGADGKGVTAIALTTTDGAVTGGTCTFSDGSSAAITVTEAPGE